MLGLGNTLSGRIVPAAAEASLDPAFSDAYSLDFDGVNDQLEIFDFEFINENISLSWWCTRTSTHHGEILFHALNDFASDRWYEGFYIAAFDNPTTGLMWYLGEDAGNQYWGSNTGDIGFNSEDGWHHFVFTVGAGPTTRFRSVPITMYMDGSSVWSGTGGSLGAEIGSDLKLKLQIGRGSQGAYTGNINDVAFFDTVLDADAVTAMYNSGDPTDLRVDAGNYDNSSNLTGYWWMGDEDSYPTITDRTSNGADGTMTNMAESDIESDVPS